MQAVHAVGDLEVTQALIARAAALTGVIDADLDARGRWWGGGEGGGGGDGGDGGDGGSSAYARTIH